MIHRRCQDRITTLETELRTTRDRITDRDTENAQLRSRADREERARWDAAGEAELLRDRLDAAQERERDLEHQIWQLECQINDLTEDDSPVAVARTRQTRAVTRALAAGYTADEVHTGTVMVGGVDRIALLDAQIAALTAQRARLAQDREVLDRMEDVMGGPF